MAKQSSKSTAVAKVQDETTLVKSLTIAPARIIDDSVEVGQISGLPTFFDDAQTASGFPPSAKFENPGDCVFGTFIEMRENVGPNNSRIYTLDVPVSKDHTEVVSVWGSAALDRLYDSFFPAIQSGDRMAVIYLGTKETKKGLNPVKLFSLKVKRAGMETTSAQAS